MIRLFFLLVLFSTAPASGKVKCTPKGDIDAIQFELCKLGGGEYSTYDAICEGEEFTYEGPITCKRIMKGYGLLTTDAFTYKGNFRNSLFSGKGTVEFAGGGKYSGEFREAMYHGKGKRVYKSGNIFDGQWRNHMRHGYGHFTWTNGNKYSGNWKNDKRHEEGVLTFKNGDVRKETYKDGKLHGKATLTQPNGEVTEQTWDNGELTDFKVLVKGKTPEEMKREKQLAERIEQRRLEREKIEEQRRAEANQKYDKIYNNCIADKLPSDANYVLQDSIIEICKDIASDPSFLDRMKYN
jgi:hypothetical protein